MENVAFTTPLSIGISKLNVGPQICTGRQSLTTAYKRSNVRMASETVIAKKSAIVDSVKERLAESQMIFAVPLDGFTVADVFKMRRELPEGTVARTVKNTLMRRAIAESEWHVVGDFLQQSNLWFFVKEDIKGSVQAYESFAKTEKKAGIKGGAFEGERCDGEGIQAIAALPTKIELITQIAVGIKMVPTKLGKTIKAIPTKVGRAIKLAVANEEGEGDTPSE